MRRLREEISNLHNLRKTSDTRELNEDDFENLEVREITRKVKESRSRKHPVRAEDVPNNLIQDKSKRMVVVGPTYS